MANNMISKDLGPATAYAIAVENGYTGTEEQWASEIANASNNAQIASQKASDAEAYAAGTRGGEAVESDDPAYHNNAEYYSGEAADSAEAAAGSATSAAESAATASAAYNVNLLAPNFVQETAYPAGQHVINDGGYYVLPNGHEADTTWENTTKTQLTVGAEAADLKSALYNDAYRYMGEASSVGTPVTTVGNVFYIATGAGTYTNFGGLVVNADEVCFLKYKASNQTWTKELLQITKSTTFLNKERKLFLWASSSYINIDFTNNQIVIPKMYLTKNKASREEVAATTLTKNNANNILYLNLTSLTYSLATVNASVDFTKNLFVATIPETKDSNVISDIPIAYDGIIKNRVLYPSRNFRMTGVNAPITIDAYNRKIIFPTTVYINSSGTNYVITNANPFEYSYNSDATYNLKTIFFDTSKLSSAVSNGLSSDCFYTRSQTASLAIDPKYELIAILPNGTTSKDILPVTAFDYVVPYMKNRSARFAKGFISSIPEVQPLTGNNKIIDATEYDQFEPIINLWDALVIRANQYGTFMKKCWADGTDYDDTEKIMSDEPTAGEHNPRSDMNKYPLIMYKLLPFSGQQSYYCKPPEKKILIVSALHGAGSDQLESPIAIYYLAKELIDRFYVSDELTNARNHYEIDFIPVANPWGVNNKSRYNGQGVDINRDFSDFNTTAATAIKNLIDSDSYEIYWDSHCLYDTSLTTGDLAGPNFFFKSVSAFMKTLGYQLVNYIGAKYSLETSCQNSAEKTSSYYSTMTAKVPGFTTELPPNTPAYYGDTVGEPHGEETMKRCVDYVQNVFAVMVNFLMETEKIRAGNDTQ